MGWAGDWGELEGWTEGMTNIIIVIINIVIVIVNVIVSSSSLGKVEGQPGGMTSLGWQCHLWGYCLLAQLDGAGVQWIKNNQGRNNKEQGEASGNVLRPSTFLVVAKKNAVFPGLKIFRRHVGREEMNLIILWAKTKSGVAIGKLTKHQNKKKKQMFLWFLAGTCMWGPNRHFISVAETELARRAWWPSTRWPWLKNTHLTMTQTTATLQEQTRGHSSKKHDLPYFRLEEDAITFKADKRWARLFVCRFPEKSFWCWSRLRSRNIFPSSSDSGELVQVQESVRQPSVFLLRSELALAKAPKKPQANFGSCKSQSSLLNKNVTGRVWDTVCI